MESLQTIISTCSPQAGLSSHIVPFASGASLKERLSAHPVLMAPMAGVSDGVYRTMARAGGAGLGLHPAPDPEPGRARPSGAPDLSDPRQEGTAGEGGGPTGRPHGDGGGRASGRRRAG